MLVGIDAVVVALCYYMAFVVRFESVDLGGYIRVFFRTLPIQILSLVAGFIAFGVYRGIWRYVSLRDVSNILKGAVAGHAALIAVVVFVQGTRGYPRSVFLIDFVLVVAAVAGMRFARRLQIERGQRAPLGNERHPVLVVGAGDAADDLLREVRTNPRVGLRVVGLVDDLDERQGTELHGVKVLGKVDDITRIVEAQAAEEIVIAIPSATGAQMRRIVERCREARVPYRTMPGAGDILGGRVRVSQLRRVRLEDLLRRDPARLDNAAISAYLSGRRVLVTGAGGSIGSELVRQVAFFGPEEICLLDHSENNLFFIEEEMARRFPQAQLRSVVADVADSARIGQVMAEVEPSVVFHAAAHKHVWLMERNFREAFRNNVTGTRVVAEAAAACHVEKFVMISTDKAVRPTTAMGLSKRIAEIVVQGMSEAGHATNYLAVRFGNVMGSDGSVIPLWQRQIAAGGPVTVTHPEVTRFFMLIPEAVALVLQAASMGSGGDIFVLDMGEPLRVLDMARQVISLSGLDPDEDIEIRFIGLRPGEKLSEELISDGEGIVKTSHEKIMALRANGQQPENTLAQIAELERAVARCDGKAKILALARGLVPEYAQRRLRNTIHL